MSFFRAVWLFLCASVVVAAPLDEVKSLIEAGDLEEAMARLEVRLDTNPDDVDARLLRGVILAEQGRLKQAEAAFKAVVRDHPRNPWPYTYLAGVHTATGRYEHARRALRQALRVKPGFAPAHRNLGDLYIDMALEQYQKASEQGLQQVEQRIDALLLFRVRHAVEPASVASVAGIVAGRVAAGNTGNGDVADPVAGNEEPSVQPAATAQPRQVGGDPRCVTVELIPRGDGYRRLHDWLQEHGGTTRVLSRVDAEQVYWVYVPSLPSARAARERMEALRLIGVRDMALVMRGPKANAISLGSYRRQDSMERRRAELRRLGVEHAYKVSEIRPPRVTVEAVLPTEQALESLRGEFPELNLGDSACGSG